MDYFGYTFFYLFIHFHHSLYHRTHWSSLYFTLHYSFCFHTYRTNTHIGYETFSKSSLHVSKLRVTPNTKFLINSITVILLNFNADTFASTDWIICNTKKGGIYWLVRKNIHRHGHKSFINFMEVLIRDKSNCSARVAAISCALIYIYLQYWIIAYFILHDL